MHPLDRERERQEQRQQDAAAKLAAKQFRQDFVKVMGEPAARRIIHDFLQVMNIDGTAFNTNAMAQSHGIGMQDAARWWLAAIREHCPEREAQMRAEANKTASRPSESEEPA